MQIFVLSPADHSSAAAEHFDSHVVKIPLEVAQMLSIVLHILVPETAAQLHESGHIYKYAKTYAKHPCVRWMLESRSNFEWTCKYGLALCDEYYYRYGSCHKQGPRQHKSRSVISLCTDIPLEGYPDLGMTEFAQAIADESLRVPGDAVAAYRAYYQSSDKAHLRKWTKRRAPGWFRDTELVPKTNKRKRKSE